MPAESTVRNGSGPDYELIETLRWERASGFINGELHLARMRNSADALGFAWSAGVAESALERGVAESNSQMLRVRLTLDGRGVANCITAPFEFLPPDTVWRVAIARTALDSSNSLLRHKTSKRAEYEAARAEYASSLADEVLLMNEREELCEGAITNLFLDMGDGGPLLTPSLECGLLKGILRGALLADGKAREAVLGRSELAAARAVYLGNSLRGLIEARVV